MMIKKMMLLLLIGKLYAVGGHDGNEHLKSGEVFDPVTNGWQSIASMSKLRSVLVLRLSQFDSTSFNCL